MKTFTTVLVAAAAILLAGCGSDSEPAPAATAASTTAVAARTSAPVKTSTGVDGFTAAEKAYLRSIDAAAVPYINKADIVAVGKDACTLLKAQPDPVNVAASLARQSQGLFSLKESATIVGSARGSGLCE